MSLFARITLLVKTGTSAILAPAPDPRETFVYSYQHQRDLLEKVHEALAELAASKGRLEAKTVEVEQKLPHLEERARRALADGREDLARLALQRREVALVELRTLHEQVSDVEQEEQRLTVVEQRLATRIEAFFAREEVIAARYSAAEAQVRVNEALGGVSKELADLGTALERAEERTEHMQARASALDELVDVGILENPTLREQDPVARQLAKIDVDEAVESQLAAMRAEARAV